MKIFRLLIISAAIVFFNVSVSASAMCGTRADFVKVLANKYQESPRSMAFAGEVNVVEVFTSKDGATWTILVTTPDGKTCIIAAGKGWEEVPQKPIIPGHDT